MIKEKLLNMTQASKFIGISRATLYSLIKKGAIPEPKIILGRKYYHIDTLKKVAMI
jgi:excisionase family DNA binding protein